MKYAKAAIATSVAFLVIDIVWISVFLKDVYDAQLGDMMRETPNGLSGGAFYVIYIFGIVFFAIRPALAAGCTKTAFINGALLGIISYGTYTLTNHAIFSQWSALLVYSDIAWGAFLTGASATLGYLAARGKAASTE